MYSLMRKHFFESFLYIRRPTSFQRMMRQS